MKFPSVFSALAALVRSTQVLLFLGLLPLASARAAVIANGSLESGFSNWSRADQVGSDGTFAVQSGTSSPVNGDPVPAPPAGVRAAMTDAQGPGSHVLYQDFLANGAALLSFSLFIGNRAAMFSSPPTLDFSTPALNQQARVDIIKSAADPFSVLSSDILLNLYQTNPGDPLVSGYTAVNFDLSALFAAHTGENLRLRFAETDNLAPFQFGVDDVQFRSSVPEPSTWVMLILGFAGVGFMAYRRRSNATLAA